MRNMMHTQLPLMQGFIEHEHAQELLVMSEALDACSEVLVRVEHDLLEDRDPSLGRPGLTADQVIRALVSCLRNSQAKPLDGFQDLIR